MMSRARRWGAPSAALSLVLSSVLIGAAAARGVPTLVSWVADPARAGQSAVEVSGLSPEVLRRLQESDWGPPQWQRLLAVYAQPGQPGQATIDPRLPPMLGAYGIRSAVLRFEPQFPLEPGVTYLAVFRPDHLPGGADAGGAAITASHRLPPREATPTTVVSHVYPTAEVLPENLLKFYIHFSAPMSRGQIYDHIRLRDAAGKGIELPFLEIGEELWDPEMKRLTLFIDPGRIKRGVRPLEEVGPALEAGKSYALVIDRAWKDGAGNPLRENFEKVFQVGPPDREPPDPARWKIQPPKPGTRDALAVIFPEPLDYALARRLIRVAGEDGEPVEGQVRLGDDEQSWSFAPGAAWRRGAYQLVIQTTLEDLAGNNIGKPFEVDLFEGVGRRLTTSTVKLRFEVR